jgi:hypothetical protein
MTPASGSMMPCTCRYRLRISNRKFAGSPAADILTQRLGQCCDGRKGAPCIDRGQAGDGGVLAGRHQHRLGQEDPEQRDLRCGRLCQSGTRQRPAGAYWNGHDRNGDRSALDHKTDLFIVLWKVGWKKRDGKVSDRYMK